MKLSQLCQNLIDPSTSYDIDIKGLALDSRDIKPGYLFLACPGTHTTGHDFIDKAIEAGAVAVLCDASPHIFNDVMITLEDGRQIPVLAVPYLLTSVGQLASQFYGEPSTHFPVYGVTGTNGKTSITHYIAQCFNQINQPCAVLGTVGNGFLDKLEESSHTTADPISLQQLLARYQEQGAKAIAMEVSSHGLDQGRVNGVCFDSAIFTNLTHDHLDYHQTMENYAAAKRKLFCMPDLKRGIFNLDDAYGRALLNEFKDKIDCYGYSVDPQTGSEFPLIKALEVQYSTQGINAQIDTPWGSAELSLSLFGHFNLSNVLAVIALLGSKGISFQEILGLVSKIKPVTGRMEMLKKAGKITVVVDYSHTPDSLNKALIAIRAHTGAKIWCVFGCGGDRDKGKRPEMGKIAEQLADHVIVTNDNPRHESAEQIAQDILDGMSYPEKVTVLLDREQAIHYAISQAHEKDVILVAGKGHENYQQVGDEKRPFSDQAVVKQILGI
ncbi:MAG: UDP-N-acetylmuramoyl-L-alanyl-D-glutamate--2,6-diaminopimelate ligase [Legionellales bacterium]|nr:UDP-N-acetylmuramoyl-L-alanyl-D-glutamate--2,6-diaminopimelate ligase [Legionellales bacterium]